MSLSVRAAAEADREAILGLWIDLIRYHQSLDPDYPPTPHLHHALREEIERGLREPGCRLLVADVAGVCKGFLFAEVESGDPPGQSWIHELWVATDSRRQGLARRLIAAAETFVRERGGSRVSVRVESKNELGLAFWRGQAFVERARIFERRGRP